MKFYREEVATVLKEVGSSPAGLTSAEAAERLEKNGKNKLKQAQKDSLIKRFFAQLTDPMIIILLVAAAISAVLASLLSGDVICDVAMEISTSAATITITSISMDNFFNTPNFK